MLYYYLTAKSFLISSGIVESFYFQSHQMLEEQGLACVLWLRGRKIFLNFCLALGSFALLHIQCGNLGVYKQKQLTHFKILFAYLIGSTLAFSTRGPWFKSWQGRNFVIFHSWVVISWVPFTLELIHDYAKWSIHELNQHV